MQHIPVLLQEVINLLDPKPGETVVDATFGFGGHAGEIATRIGDSGKLFGIEKDLLVIDQMSPKLKRPNIKVINGDFRNIKKLLEKQNVKSVDKIIFDLGVSSYHFDSSGRGFSFTRDEPLDMRLDSNSGLTAAQIVNSLSRDELADLFYQLADEFESRTIARAIYDERRKNPITTTSHLGQIVTKAKHYSGKTNPATKVFQALRIAVNDELHAISDALPQAINLLKSSGKIVVISFHSGEDRLVKNVFKKYLEEKKIKILTKKPVVASREEKNLNPRSRSAKLRMAERI